MTPEELQAAKDRAKERAEAFDLRRQKFVLTEEADTCCKNAWFKILRSVSQPSDMWECPKCGQEYQSQLVETILVWNAKSWATVLR